VLKTDVPHTIVGRDGVKYRLGSRIQGVELRGTGSEVGIHGLRLGISVERLISDWSPYESVYRHLPEKIR
jgi:hypothetical protein